MDEELARLANFIRLVKLFTLPSRQLNQLVVFK
jgi:hypothetical protein